MSKSQIAHIQHTLREVKKKLRETERALEELKAFIKKHKK